MNKHARAAPFRRTCRLKVKHERIRRSTPRGGVNQVSNGPMPRALMLRMSTKGEARVPLDPSPPPPFPSQPPLSPPPPPPPPPPIPCASNLLQTESRSYRVFARMVRHDTARLPRV